jgi:hypothetical protein
MKKMIAALIILVIMLAAVPVFACGKGSPGWYWHYYGWAKQVTPPAPAPAPAPAPPPMTDDGKGGGPKTPPVVKK